MCLRIHHGLAPANGEEQRSLACFQPVLHPEAKDGLRLRNPAHDHAVTYEMETGTTTVGLDEGATSEADEDRVRCDCLISGCVRGFLARSKLTPLILNELDERFEPAKMNGEQENRSSFEAPFQSPSSEPFCPPS